jgi:hypothetical protein
MNLQLLKHQFALLVLVAGVVSPTFASKRITGERLEEILSAARAEPDAAVAKQLLAIELSERIGSARLERCEAELPGPHSRDAFVAMTDVAAFLDPAPGDVPALAKPDDETQKKMIDAAGHYAGRTLYRLPNFFATRVTTSFQDDPWFQSSASDFTNYKPLLPVGRYAASVFYREGKEGVDAQAAQASMAKGGPTGLTTFGEFGPILVIAVLDATHGKLSWSHWEQGATAPIAVFHYAISAKDSHYAIEKRPSAYEGEIALDPVDGTIFRVTLKSSGAWNAPLARADLLVEYGPVEIGDKTYICPKRGIALSAVRDIQFARASPIRLALNDVVFQDYHLYRAKVRILNGNNAPPPGNPALPAPQ